MIPYQQLYPQPYYMPPVILPDDIMYDEEELYQIQKNEMQPKYINPRYFRNGYQDGGFLEKFNNISRSLPSIGSLWGNDASPLQQGIGIAADAGLNFIPGVGPALSKLGVGSAATNLAFKAFGPERYEPNQALIPSGRTTGVWRDYQDGGRFDYMRAKHRSLDQVSRYKRVPVTRKLSGYQMGGIMTPMQMTEQFNALADETPLEKTAEIEGDEYVFNSQGIDQQKFKMFDNHSVQHESPYGFLAKGKSHSKGGISVNASDAYIASKYLGLNGKKSGKNNPSVASEILKVGGSQLGKGYTNKADKFGIGPWNKGAEKWHLQAMEEVKATAEEGKIIQELKQIAKDKSLKGIEKEFAIAQALSKLSI